MRMSLYTVILFESIRAVRVITWLSLGVRSQALSEKRGKRGNHEDTMRWAAIRLGNRRSAVIPS
jgi:hypothetical protein